MKGMVDDIQMLKEEIINITSRAERQRQECMIAKLVQWCFFEVIITVRVVECKNSSMIRQSLLPGIQRFACSALETLVSRRGEHLFYLLES